MSHRFAFNLRIPFASVMVFALAVAMIGCGPKRVRMGVAPQADPAPGTVAPFSHQLFGDVLAETVDAETGRVSYAAVAAMHLPALERYLAEASVTAPETWPSSDQKAFWINAHNAAAIHLIASDWESFSTGDRGLRTGIFTPDPGYRIAGKWYTLADMRRHMLRTFDDPRMLYALNWGAKGSAPLAPHPVRAATLELDLADAKDRYVASQRGMRVDGGRLIVEGLYVLYADELLDGRDALRFARAHLGSGAMAGVTETERHRFDWDLDH